MAAKPEDVMKDAQDLFPGAEMDDEEYQEPTPEERGDILDMEEKAEEEPKAEEQEEPEAEEQEESEAEEEEDVRIPKARFDEVNEERKRYKEELEQLRRELEELKRGRETKTTPEDEEEVEDLDVPAYDFEAKEREYAQALLDGDTAKASALRKEINEKLVEIASAVSSREARQAQELVRQQLAYEKAVEELNAKYPELVPDNPNYDQGVIDEIFDLYEGYVMKGLTPADAIRKSTEIIAKLHGLGQKPEEEQPKAGLKKQPKVDKKLEAKKKQPPRQSGASPREAEEEYDILNMTEEEFDALPDSVKKRLRGDF